VHADSQRLEAKQEENLLVEAVSLLVQRQRELESAIAEQISAADERSAAAEQRYAELEARLATIEEQLNRLAAHNLSAARPEGSAGERLARLRDQVEGLRSAPDGRPSAPRSPLPQDSVRREPEPIRAIEAPRPAPVRPETATVDHASSLFGATSRDRFGLALIAVGVLAVAYAVLSQLRLG
jgi:hypothetical protein